MFPSRNTCIYLPLAFALLGEVIGEFAAPAPQQVKTTDLLPSHDLFVRRDNSRNYGQSNKITVTQAGSNQRIGLMKFDTSSFVVGQDGSSKMSASLRLAVADMHESENPVQVKIYRLMDENLNEDHYSWEQFDGRTHDDHEHVSFVVESSHKGKVGKVDVTSLLREGEDTVLAFAIEDEGHVKFHSKESDHNHFIPKLILTEEEDEL